MKKILYIAIGLSLAITSCNKKKNEIQPQLAAVTTPTPVEVYPKKYLVLVDSTDIADSDNMMLNSTVLNTGSYSILSAGKKHIEQFIGNVNDTVKIDFVLSSDAKVFLYQTDSLYSVSSMTLIAGGDVLTTDPHYRSILHP